MRVVRAADLVAVPWKNGGGITREILRAPPDGARFTWRLSCADIEVPGPFSSFEGYARTLVLVRGKGLLLRFADHGEARLTAPGHMAEFDGGWQTCGTPLDGPCMDLNLMVVRTLHPVQTRCVPLARPQSIDITPSQATLLVCLAGAAELTSADGSSVVLEDLDTAHAVPEDRTIRCAPRGATTLLFVAQLGV